MLDAQIPGPNEHTHLIGHERLEKEFLGCWNKQQVPHALLFAGPKGVGKATFAYQVARFVLESCTQKNVRVELFWFPTL